MAPPRFRFVLRFLLPAAVLAGAACAGPTGRRPQPPSSQSVQLELGQRDVIQAGEEYARNNSIVLAETSQEAVEIRPNYWRIRFALADQPGQLLELEFDELARRVTRAQQIEIVPDADTSNTVEGSQALPPGGATPLQ